ncbi:hypothetical protein GCM10010172_06740 [Paractinoplanes ferrugineus]|uniref:Uncharacterized protein n=1 Tax=Paractinoplanes ferrugineus TaxID=113564 RepID=A0A919J8X4_9ACTN|nr:hypothetical protein [Actinoplanes ferrugineus]GIE16298.1 hypothetical protein Afe05nite_81380 [Actinoplanes ferrugineus]
MTVYTALHGISAPGTSVFGYQRGHEVPEVVVANWNLIVGDDGSDADVTEGPLADLTPATVVVVRPDDGANRAAWEAYAVAAGMTEKDAAQAPLEELQAERDAKGKPVERPADNAKKADWVAYVKKLGADKAWADDDTTTRADLQAWTPDHVVPVADPAAAPAVGDPIAVAATAANQADGPR